MSDITPRGDISKLPKWAREYIGVLVRNAERLTAQLDAVTGDSDSAAIFWTDGIRGGKHGGIPGSATVEFRVSCGYIDAHVMANGKLRISGDPIIAITPSAANTIEVDIPGTGKAAE